MGRFGRRALSKTRDSQLRSGCGLPCLLLCVVLAVLCIFASHYLLRNDQRQDWVFTPASFVPVITEEERRERQVAGEYFEMQDQCDHDTMTVVTGYFNIGSFRKGHVGNFTAEHYQKWASALQSIENPLVFNTDDASMARLVATFRNQSDMTRRCTQLHLVNRSEIWAFRLRDEIVSVIGRRDYPRFYPNTVLPEYGSVMHAKCDLLDAAMRTGKLATPYVAWMDAGLFREESDWKNRTIRLLPPTQHDHRRVSFNLVYEPHFDWSPETIFRKNHVYVGGGYFLATQAIMRDWCEQYRNFTEYFLKRRLSNTDQQVIYAMFTREFDKHKEMHRSVNIQTFAYMFRSDSDGNWYQLRDLSRDHGGRQANLSSSLTPTPTPKWNVTQTACKLDSNLTIVIGFFSYGAFAVPSPSGTGGNWIVRDEAGYQRLAQSSALMKNSLIAYSDSTRMLSAIEKARASTGLFGCTRTKFISRADFWSWSHLAMIRQRLNDSQSVELPEYYAAKHSKLEFMRMAADENPFDSLHFAWVDLSLMHTLSTSIKKQQRFALRLIAEAPSSLDSIINRRGEQNFDIQVGAYSPPNHNQNQNQNQSTVCSGSLSISTNYIIASGAAFQLSAAIYQAILERTLDWNLTLSDSQLFEKTLCWSNLSLSLSSQLRIRPYFVKSTDWQSSFAFISAVFSS